MRFLLLSILVILGATATTVTTVESAEAQNALDLYIVHRGGTDANGGTTFADGIRTLRRAEQILHQTNPRGPVNIWVQGGTYHCRGMNGEPWDFFNGSRVTITSLDQTIPSPASTSRDDERRPVFVGQLADGTPCPDRSGTFLRMEHPKVATNLTVSNLRFEYYKAAFQISGVNGYTRVQQGNVFANNVFWRIGDLYFPDAGAGKGVFQLDHTNGTMIRDNFFWHIRNAGRDAALVHAAYLTRRASWTTFDNNVVGGLSGIAVKISHFSNYNRFSNNDFMYAPAAIIDRFCGSRENPDEDGCNGGITQCPSWGNVVEANNTFTHLEFDWDVGVYSFDPESQPSECTLAGPRNDVRMQCLRRMGADTILRGTGVGSCRDL